MMEERAVLPRNTDGCERVVIVLSLEWYAGRAPCKIAAFARLRPSSVGIQASVTLRIVSILYMRRVLSIYLLSTSY